RRRLIEVERRLQVARHREIERRVRLHDLHAQVRRLDAQIGSAGVPAVAPAGLVGGAVQAARAVLVGAARCFPIEERRREAARQTERGEISHGKRHSSAAPADDAPTHGANATGRARDSRTPNTATTTPATTAAPPITSSAIPADSSVLPVENFAESYGM